MNLLLSRIELIQDTLQHLIGDPEELFAAMEAMATGFTPTGLTERIPDNEVPGCQSRLWFTVSIQSERLQCTTWSDAIVTRIISGLIANTLSGVPVAQIRDFDMETFICACGLDQTLSPRRLTTIRNLGRSIADCVHSASVAA